MGDLFFFAKMIVITVVVVVLMQIKIGDSTLEYKFLNWVHTSTALEPMQQAAQGAVAVVREVWKKVTDRFSDNVTKTFDKANQPGSRLNITLKRSQEYLQQQAEKARQKLQDEKMLQDLPGKAVEMVQDGVDKVLDPVGVDEAVEPIVVEE